MIISRDFGIISRDLLIISRDLVIIIFFEWLSKMCQIIKRYREIITRLFYFLGGHNVLS